MKIRLPYLKTWVHKPSGESSMSHKRNLDGRAGARLSEIRASRGISQAWLAKLVGVTPGAIQAYERGRSRMTIERLEQLAHALKCEPAELLKAAGSAIAPFLYRRPQGRGPRP
jgi:transcriptional regulator with XRE-family HTH domain